MLQRTTRSLALGWGLTWFCLFWGILAKPTCDSKPAFLRQEYFPDQNVHRLQGRAHLGVHRRSSLSQSVHSSAEGLLLHEPAPLHHGHQHCLLEHSCRSDVACTLFNRWFVSSVVFKSIFFITCYPHEVLLIVSRMCIGTLLCYCWLPLLPPRVTADYMAGDHGGHRERSSHVSNQHPHHHHLPKHQTSDRFKIPEQGRGQLKTRQGHGAERPAGVSPLLYLTQNSAESSYLNCIVYFLNGCVVVHPS